MIKKKEKTPVMSWYYKYFDLVYILKPNQIKSYMRAPLKIPLNVKL